VLPLVCAGLLLSVTACSRENPRVVTTFNQPASVPVGLPFDPLKWRVITSAIDHRDSTMYTLFGNDKAIDYARSHTEHEYPKGSVLALVTWHQQEDPRWFGGNIPALLKSVEFVTVGVTREGQPLYSYQDFEGFPLKNVSTQKSSTPEGRTAYLLSQRAAVMP
jgi:hypothetical protein